MMNTTATIVNLQARWRCAAQTQILIFQTRNARSPAVLFATMMTQRVTLSEGLARSTSTTTRAPTVSGAFKLRLSTQTTSAVRVHQQLVTELLCDRVGWPALRKMGGLMTISLISSNSVQGSTILQSACQIPCNWLPKQKSRLLYTLVSTISTRTFGGKAQRRLSKNIFKRIILSNLRQSTGRWITKHVFMK